MSDADRQIQVLDGLGGDDSTTYHLARFDGRMWVTMRRALGTANPEAHRRAGDLARRLRHENVITTVATGTGEGGLPYTLEEHMVGLSAAELRDAGAVPWVVGARIVRGLGGGVAQLIRLLSESKLPLPPSMGPSRIAVSFDGRAKLVDPLQHVRGAEPTGHERFGYTAPEVLRGAEPTAAALVFSLGTVLWELCAGRKLFVAGSLEEARELMSYPVVDRLEGKIAGFPGRLDEILQIALAKSPEERFRSPDALAGALTVAIGTVAADIAPYMQKTHAIRHGELKEWLRKQQQMLSVPPMMPAPARPDPENDIATQAIRRSVLPKKGGETPAPAAVLPKVPALEPRAVRATEEAPRVATPRGMPAPPARPQPVAPPRTDSGQRRLDPDATLKKVPAMPPPAHGDAGPLDTLPSAPLPRNTAPEPGLDEPSADDHTVPFRREQLEEVQNQRLGGRSGGGYRHVAVRKKPDVYQGDGSSEDDASTRPFRRDDLAIAEAAAAKLRETAANRAAKVEPSADVPPTRPSSPEPQPAPPREPAAPPQAAPEPVPESAPAGREEVFDEDGALRLVSTSHAPPVSLKPMPEPEASVIVNATAQHVALPSVPDAPHTQPIPGLLGAPTPQALHPAPMTPHVITAPMPRQSAPPPPPQEAPYVAPAMPQPAPYTHAAPPPQNVTLPHRGGAMPPQTPHMVPRLVPSTPPPAMPHAVSGSVPPGPADPTVQVQAHKPKGRWLDVVLLLATLVFLVFIAWMLLGRGKSTADVTPQRPVTAATASTVATPATATGTPGLGAAPTPSAPTTTFDTARAAAPARTGRRGDVPPGSSGVPSASAAPSVEPTAAPAPSATSALAAPTASATEEPSGSSTYLTVVCSPACDEVDDGGKSLGPSPIYRVRTSPGAHTLRLHWANPPAEKTVSVNAKDGEVTSVRVSAP